MDKLWSRPMRVTVVNIRIRQRPESKRSDRLALPQARRSLRPFVGSTIDHPLIISGAKSA